MKPRNTGIEPTRVTAPAARASSLRLRLLLVVGLALVVGAWYVRSSPWMHEIILRGKDLSQLQSLVRAHPEDALAQYYLGKRYFQQRHYAEAHQAEAEAVRLEPEVGRYHLDLGYALFELGQMSRARSEFAAAVRLDHSLAPAEFMLGRILWMQGDPAEALPHVKRATELNPRNDHAWYGMAVCLIQLQHRNEALAPLQKAVAINDNRPEYHTALGELELALSDNIADARRQYERALQLDPNFGPACALMGSLYLHYSTDKASLDRAEQLLVRATQLRTYRPEDLYRDLGDLYFKRGEYQKAIPALQRSIHLDPRDERSYYALVKVYRKLGDAKSAAATQARFHFISDREVRKDSLEVRLRYYPNDAATHLSLAQVYRDLGMTQKAISQYEIYRNLQPGATDPGMEQLLQEYARAAPGSPQQDFAFPALR